MGDFKQMQMDNSASTSSRLALELDRRKLELQKINMLDQKIEVELQEKREKMSEMEKELEGLKDLKEVKSQLSKDALAVQIDELEGRVKHQESTVYALSDYIETKGAESHFEPLAEDCSRLIKVLNTETIRVLAEAPVFQHPAY